MESDRRNGVDIPGLRKPSIQNRLLEAARLREVAPPDICETREALDELYETYPDLAGDRNAIGFGDDGDCQSWRDDPGWWKSVVG